MNEYFWFWWVFAIVLVGIAICTGENWDALLAIWFWWVFAIVLVGIAILAIAWGGSGFAVFMGMVKKL